MEANELMIGDWVKLQNVDSYFKIGFISVDSIWNDIDTTEWDLDEIEPIPLTPKILEKNGFVYNAIPFVDGWELHIMNNARKEE